MKSFSVFIIIFVECLLGIFADVPTTPDNICLPNPPALKAEQLSAPFTNCDSKSKTGKHPDQDLKTVENKKRQQIIIFCKCNHLFCIFLATTFDKI